MTCQYCYVAMDNYIVVKCGQLQQMGHYYTIQRVYFAGDNLCQSLTMHENLHLRYMMCIYSLLNLQSFVPKPTVWQLYRCK